MANTPTTIALDFTFAFVRPLIRPLARVLEVGCGTGELAMQLHNSGVNIVAIDVDEKAVETARANAVNAIACGILDIDEKFDVLLFTRSLHHMHNLDEVLRHARNILAPEGVIILEEFDVENVNVATARWYYRKLTEFEDAGLLAAQAISERSPLRRWKAEHCHIPPLNAGKMMMQKMRMHCRGIELDRVPYLFRAFEHTTDTTMNSAHAIKALFEEELALIKSKAILPVGLRLIGFKARQ